MMERSQVRTYRAGERVSFRRTKEEFGGLSNMASGFPIEVNGVRIRTSEALYQASRFPHKADIQRLIIQERSPMTAKMKSRRYVKETRPEWERIRINVMRWCLRVKLAQNWQKFGALLLATGDQPIVEDSRRDDFWGAKAADYDTLVGVNVLGRLLMELREELRDPNGEELKQVEPPSIDQFLLYGTPVGVVKAYDLEQLGDTETLGEQVASGLRQSQAPTQKPMEVGGEPGVVADIDGQPAITSRVGNKTLTIAGQVSPETWNRLGARFIPKLRSSGDVNITANFQVTVPSSTASSVRAELRQAIDDLGLSDSLSIETT